MVISSFNIMKFYFAYHKNRENNYPLLMTTYKVNINCLRTSAYFKCQKY